MVKIYEIWNNLKKIQWSKKKFLNLDKRSPCTTI